MSAPVLTNEPARDGFLRDADAYRRELVARCYRMIGSVHEGGISVFMDPAVVAMFGFPATPPTASG
jgi:hypothetical protein